MKPFRQAFVGVGANLGDRGGTLRSALHALGEQPAVSFVAPSPVYETDPVGLREQPPFLNAVFGLETTLPPEALLGTLQSIEETFGRTRPVRWGPRTLDLDLLAYEYEARDTAALQLPHPRALARAFVTTPWAALFAHPRFQRPCWALLRLQLPRPPPGPDVRPYPNCRLEPWERARP